jgi:hypothetical protein
MVAQVPAHRVPRILPVRLANTDLVPLAVGELAIAWAGGSLRSMAPVIWDQVR